MIRKLFSKNHFAKKRLTDEKVFEMVLDELEQGQKAKGLWGKALANSQGNLTRAESLYIRYRAQSIVDEVNLTLEFNENKKQQSEVSNVTAATPKESKKSYTSKEHTNLKVSYKYKPGYKEGKMYAKSVLEIRLLLVSRISYDECINELKKNYLDNIDAALQGFTDHVEKLTHKGKVSLSADSDDILFFVKQ